jgi:hypothetical protein
VAPVPEDTLKEISMNLGLSMSVLPVGLSRFEENINTALETLHVRRE